MHTPNDETTQQVAELTSNADLMTQASNCKPGDLKALSQLRQTFQLDASQAATTLQFAEGRRKAINKFGSVAQQWIAWPDAIEQATSRLVGEYKAQQLVKKTASSSRRIVDACCGIGGDLWCFQHAGLTCTGIELDPTRAWMAQHNAQVTIHCQDVVDFDWQADDVMHLDPARRSEGKRLFDLHQLIPSPEVWLTLLNKAPNSVIKLAPGVDMQALEDLGLYGQLEIISLRGKLVQALLWTGNLQHTNATTNNNNNNNNTCDQTAQPIATLLTTKPNSTQSIDHPPIIHQFCSPWTYLETGPCQEWIWTVDPAIERIDRLGALAAELDIKAIHPSLGILTHHQPIHSPWLTGYRVLEQMPFRENKVKKALQSLDAGLVIVKTRGQATDPDRLQKQLRGKGQRTLTVFVLRDGKQKFCLITEAMA